MQATNRLHAFRRDLSELPPGRRRFLITALAASCLLFLAGFSLTIYLWHLARQFPQAPFAQPSRLYGSATQLAPGEPLTVSAMLAELRQAGYREVEGGDEKTPLRRGTFRRQGNRVEVHVRPFPTPHGQGGGVPVEVDVRSGRIAQVRVAGRTAEAASLEPPLLASFYGPDLNERRPVTLDELPEHVVRAVLAAEDGNFYLHPGVSPTGVARALWVNLRGGAVQQGGSTITQQLVKNLYLSSERTISRKVKEAVIAVMLEVRYGKRAILEAYLNEIYWGRSGPANVIGLGAAAHAWFGKDAAELSLAEAATLAAMIRAPGDYSPVNDVDKVIDRRNWVLLRMADLGWISPDRARRAWREPLRPDPQTVNARPLAPYFARFAADEAKERFDVELPDEGYLLFSTLGWREQQEAERAVSQGLSTLEKGWERRRRSKDPLQAALVSVDPRNGAILAWVGGRDYEKSEFDRVSNARRQAGSTVKPVIYAAAFREAVANPSTLLRDSPIVVRVGTTQWRPQNNDRGFRGWVTVRAALEQSLNIPTVRMALQVGLPRVIETARDMGIGTELAANPALALGAFEVTPLELAQVYATLANGGNRPPLHGLAAVHDRFGEPILGDDLPAPQRVLPPQAAWLVTNILQGVMDRGTGAGVRRFGIRDRLAGKTGTTNDRRDSWFAGYTPDQVTVVWVGYDDNAETQLSGARAALPIWSRFVAAVRPAGGFLPFTPPPGIVQVTVDPLTGQIATPYCPYRVTEQFAEWQVPGEHCHRHRPGGTEAWADVNLSGVPIDPATGEPLAGAGWDPAQEYGIDPAAFPEAYPEGDGTLDAGYSAGVYTTPGQTFPAEPVEIDPSAVGTTAAEDGSILIRPAKEEPAPSAPPPPAGPPAAEPRPAPAELPSPVTPPPAAPAPTEAPPIGALGTAEQEEPPPPPPPPVFGS